MTTQITGSSPISDTNEQVSCPSFTVAHCQVVSIPVEELVSISGGGRATGPGRPPSSVDSVVAGAFGGAITGARGGILGVFLGAIGGAMAGSGGFWKSQSFAV